MFMGNKIRLKVAAKITGNCVQDRSHMTRVEIKDFHPVASRATQFKNLVAPINFQWPFDGQVQAMDLYGG